MLRTPCPACDAPLRRGLASWHFECAACGLECSTLVPVIGTQAHTLDETARATGLQGLRKHNFALLLAWMAERPVAPGARLLEVGCAHGWFLEKAAASFHVVGIEPEPLIARDARARGLSVREGFFPDVLAEGERFDGIVFNDVLEHIPGVAATLSRCRAHLAEAGAVIINAPDNRGALYRLSRWLHRAGMRGPFERMWQHGMPSPHLYYFGTRSMAHVAARAGFALARHRTLPAVTTRGLHARIRSDRRTSPLFAVVATLAMGALMPLLERLPSDIRVWELIAATPSPRTARRPRD